MCDISEIRANLIDIRLGWKYCNPSKW